MTGGGECEGGSGGGGSGEDGDGRGMGWGEGGRGRGDGTWGDGRDNSRYGKMVSCSKERVKQSDLNTKSIIVFIL